MSKDTVSNITDRVIEEMQTWWARPLESVYAAVFTDAIMVRVRDGQVRNRPVYAAIGVDLHHHKDILRMWVGDGEGGSEVLARGPDRAEESWRQGRVLRSLDGLKGLADSVNAVFPLATVQTCIIHLIRGSLRYASRKYWDALAKDLTPIYTAATAEAAAGALDDLEEKWGRQSPAMIRLWRNAWSEFIPFLDYDVEIRRDICSTNAIESLNAHYRRAVKARGHFPTEQAAMKPLPGHQVPGPQGTGQTRWAVRWKPAPNAFAITLRRPYAGRREPINEDATYTDGRTDHGTAAGGPWMRSNLAGC